MLQRHFLERSSNHDVGGCCNHSFMIVLFQGLFKVYPLPSDPNEEIPVKVLGNVPSTEPEECIVRIYCIKANDLQPNDPTGLVSQLLSVFCFVFLAFDFCRFCVVIWFFHPRHNSQWPRTSNGFSMPDLIHYIYFPILILEKESVFSLLNVQC